jgi:hypothetical protein
MIGRVFEKRHCGDFTTLNVPRPFFRLYRNRRGEVAWFVLEFFPIYLVTFFPIFTFAIKLNGCLINQQQIVGDVIGFDIKVINRFLDCFLGRCCCAKTDFS